MMARPAMLSFLYGQHKELVFYTEQEALLYASSALHI